MEQRRLRLGDILDDYCPRERRVTNHAVVAMVEEDVKQTRCTTCDAEHPYKAGRPPRRRKKDPGEALYEEVLAGLPDADVPHPVTHVPVPSVAEAIALGDAEVLNHGNGNGHEVEPEPVSAGQSTDDDLPEAVDEPAESEVPEVEEGPFHRRLIRATLPRPEGQKDVRQVPDFTMRSNGAFRGDRNKMRGPGGTGAGNGQGGRRFSGGQQGTPGARGANGSARGNGRPGFGGGRGPSNGGGRGPGGPGRGPAGPGGPRKRSR